MTGEKSNLVFCYCNQFPSSFDMSGTPLISLFNKQYPPTELPLTGCFLFLTPLCVNSGDAYAGEICLIP